MLERVENAPDGIWRVRDVPPYLAVKLYRCPGCNQEVAPGVGHLVAWPETGRASDTQWRRHWHRSCWRHRATRRPVLSRPRG